MEQLCLGIARGRLARKNCVARTLKFLSLGTALGFLLVSCAAPGEPIAREPAVAPGINDLTAQQIGNLVVLAFSPPKETAQGTPLRVAPEIKIYREFLPATSVGIGSPEQPSAPKQLILTVAPQMEAQYLSGGRLRIPTSLSASEVAAHAGQDAVYMVRTRISARDSADSNLAEALILPFPGPAENLHAQVTKSAIELSWTAVRAPQTGALIPTSIRYRIYRAPGVPIATMQTPSEVGESKASPADFILLSEVPAPAFSDTNFIFGQTYEYKVRCVAHYEAGEVESEDSDPLIVIPRDTFPPAAPQGLVAAVVAARGGEPPHVDLSWDISPETDVAGYNVYQSEQEAIPGSRMNSQLLPTPVFRVISVVAGRRYFYRVTAVDRSGIESAPSAAVAVTLPGANEQEKR